ncbi:MAG: hypothetical protein PHU64_06815 [Candidatus Omnitrophica bacterium]|nr:hypothetical protein [Candidatus Omnitrophota bacterium]MDD5429495.1 hypothetical protein [Candidatus Omnitrophota bacterium]
MKTKYSLRDNLLIINNNATELEFPGIWSIDLNNCPVYTFLGPEYGRLKQDLPEKITFKGQWSLDTNHNLTFNLNHTKAQAPGKLYLKTELVSFESNSLTFSLGAKEGVGSYKVRLLQLKGKWQADEDNRICFLVKRTGLKQETLTFESSWKVKNNTLSYSYKTTELKTRQKSIRQLSIKGFWSILKKNRLVYALDIDGESLFNFKAYFQTPSIQGKKGAVQYRLGAGFRKGPQDQIITLYGVWKFNKDGISFEMDYGNSKIKALRFKANVRLKGDNNLVFDLKSLKGEDLGLSITFRRSFFNQNAQWFLRLAQEKKDSRIVTGFDFLW